MASNAVRKLPPDAHVDHSLNSPEAIIAKKEGKRREIKDLFSEVRNRTEGASVEVDRMQAELLDLLEQIPAQESVDFKDRLDAFGFRFAEVKKHLKGLPSEVGANNDLDISDLPPEAVQIVEENESAPVQESIESVKLEDFVDDNGSVLNGEVSKGRKNLRFEGHIYLENGDRYKGVAFSKPKERNFKFHGEGTLEKKSGQVLDGFFQNGKLDKGHLITYLEDGTDDIQFVQDGKVVSREVGQFDRDGQLTDGNVLDIKTGEPIEIWKNGKQVESGLTPGSEKDFDERLAQREAERKAEAQAIIEKFSKITGSLNSKDARGQELKGSLAHTPEGQHIFSGDITFRGEHYKGSAVLDQNGVFRFEDPAGKLTTQEFGDNEMVQEGEFRDDKLFNGTKILTGKGYSGYEGVTRSVTTMKDGVSTEKFYEVKNHSDKNKVLFNGQINSGDKDDVFVGEFTMPNGSVYKGEAIKNQKGEFEWLPGKKERTKSATLIDKFKDLFGKRKKSEVKPTPVVSEEAKKEPALESPDGTMTAKEIIAKVSKLDKLDNFVDAYGQVLNGKLTHTADGKHIFEGKIESNGAHKYQYEGKALLNEEGMFEPYEGQEDLKLEAQKTKEKGWLAKKAEAVFNRTNGKVASEGVYKALASVFGVKIATDTGFVVVAKVLEKMGKADTAAKVGEFSDLYKVIKGSGQIKEIKAGFEEFVATLKPEDGKNFEKDVIDTKYSALKAKIENANQLDPEAKGKLLARLEKVKQNFDAENKKLEEAQEAELQQAIEAYLVKKVSGMQIARDASNAALTLAGLQFARGALMAGTKIVERVAKNDVFNLQMELEGKKQIGMMKDFGIAMLETASGLTGGFFGLQKKDLKTGKELTGGVRVANAFKEIGNVFVAIGVGRLALEDTSHISEVFSKFADNVSNAKGGEFLHNWMVNAEKQLNFILHPVDSVKDSWNKTFADKDHPAPHRADVLPKAGGNIPRGVATNPAEHGSPKSVVAGSEAAVATAAAGSASAGLEAGSAGDVASSEAIHSSSGEILAIKDVSKVHDFASWRHEMMSQNMGYKFHGGKIEHALLFHKDAKIELVGADDKVADTYIFKKGGSTWDAMDKFHKDHPELFNKGKESLPRIRLIDTGDDKHPTIKVLDQYRVESHRAGHVQFKEGAAVDKAISADKLPKGDFHAQKMTVGPNIQKALPEGWKVIPDDRGLVEGIQKAGGGGERIWIYNVDNPDLALAQNMHTLDISTGRVFDFQGNHVDNLHFGKTPSDTIVATGPSRVSWSGGGNVDNEIKQKLAHNIFKQPAEKVTVAENVAKGDKVHHGGGGAHKEKIVQAEPRRELVDKSETKTSVNKGVEVKNAGVQADAPVEAGQGQQAPATEQLLAQEVIITDSDSLKAIDSLIAKSDFGDREKGMLSNWKLILDWQRELDGKDGTGLKNFLQDHAIVDVKDPEAESMIAKLVKRNKDSIADLFKDLQSGRSFNAIKEDMSEKMFGFKDIPSGKIIDSDKSHQAFLDSEEDRLKGYFKNLLQQQKIDKVG